MEGDTSKAENEGERDGGADQTHFHSHHAQLHADKPQTPETHDRNTNLCLLQNLHLKSQKLHFYRNVLLLSIVS